MSSVRQFHGRPISSVRSSCGINNDDDLITAFLCKLQLRFFIVIQLQHMLPGIAAPLTHILCQVITLTSNTADDQDAHIIVIRNGVLILDFN